MSEAAGYGTLLHTPGVARLFLSSTFSRAGDGMFSVVLVLFVLERFGSPTLAGLAAFCTLAPGLVLGPLAGALLDRYGPRKPMLLDHAASAAVIGLMAGLAAAGSLTAPSLLALTAAYSATSSLGSAGARSLLPAIVPERLWDRANAADAGAFTVADTGGLALAGALFAVLGGVGALFATAAAFAVAALALARPVGDAGPKSSTGVSVARQAWEGLRYVAAHRTLRGLAASYSLYNVGVGVLSVVLPVLVLGRLSGGEFAVGALYATLGAAGVLGSIVLGRVGTVGRERRIIVACMLLSALPLLALPFAGGLAAAFACVLAMGLVSGPVDVPLLSLRQRRTDPARLGRVLSVHMSLNLAGFPIGAAISGPLVGISPAVALASAALACASAGLLALLTVE